MRHETRLPVILALIGLAACSGEKREEGKATAPRSASPSAKLTGRAIELTVSSDAKGNYFEPSHFEAHEGDVLRVRLVTGVHNINFLPDSNPGKVGLPAPSALLQLPGQTLDIPLTFGKGDFYFQCDPHALLGMKGRVHVDE